jgi:uncharacterized protein (DUF2126 family)
MTRASTLSGLRPIPGVIEVNVHPATSWEECKAITEGVYEEARQTRLGADKFMIDGRTPAPAAAITWWSAEQLRSTARSCDGRTFWQA